MCQKNRAASLFAYFMLELEIVDHTSRFKEIEPEWLSFANTVPGLTPFQLPTWQLIWWKRFGSGELHIMVFRNRSLMVGVIPAFLHSWNNKRQMTLIGSGISDYLDPAISPSYCEAVVDCLRDHLHSVDYEVCDWQDLSQDTPLKLLQVDESYTLKIAPDTPCTEIPLSGSFEEFWGARSSGLRRNVRRYSDQARKSGELQFQTMSGADPELVDSLIRLHTARWERARLPGMVAANGSAEFLREVIERFGRARMLYFFSMRYQRKIVAVIASFPYRRILYSYLSAFDPEHEHFGFGRMLLFEALRHSYEKNYLVWNFLRGSEPYKYSWGARDIPRCRLTLSRQTQICHTSDVYAHVVHTGQSARTER